MQPTLVALVLEARRELRLTGQSLADLIGSSLRSVHRHTSTGGLSDPVHYQRLVQALYPASPALAAQIAAALGKDLAALGVQLPPPPPAPPPPAPPPPPVVSAPLPPAVPRATQAHADAVLCAAADALDSVPRNARPVVAAIFAKVRELEVDLPGLVALLAPQPAKS